MRESKEGAKSGLGRNVRNNGAQPDQAKTIHLLFCADRKFEYAFLATLISALSNLRAGWTVSLYLAVIDAADFDEQRIREALGSYTDLVSAVHIFRPPVEMLQNYTHGRTEKESHALRLAVLWLLPPGLEKIIYLDCDLYIHASIHELWEIPLLSAIAAVSDIGAVLIRSRVDFKLIVNCPAAEEPAFYFNAGVLVIDLTAWRNEGFGSKSVELGRSNDLSIIDQDNLNLVYATSVQELDADWNFQTVYPIARLRFAITEGRFTFFGWMPKIVHFVGWAKPWHMQSTGLFAVNRYRGIWQKVLGQSLGQGKDPTPYRLPFGLRQARSTWVRLYTESSIVFATGRARRNGFLIGVGAFLRLVFLPGYRKNTFTWLKGK